LHNHKPLSSKAKTRAAVCAVWLAILVPVLPTAGGEIRVDSGEEMDTTISVDPNTPSTNPGTVVIKSGEGEDTVMEANPPESRPDASQPIIITPEIWVQEPEPWPHRRSSGRP
jgi:hypothetical protein